MLPVKSFKQMKKLLATLSVVVFTFLVTSFAMAESNTQDYAHKYYKGYQAELILMYGEVLQSFVAPLRRDPLGDAIRLTDDSMYHLKLTPEALKKMRANVGFTNSAQILDGIYKCEIKINNITPYLCYKRIKSD